MLPGFTGRASLYRSRKLYRWNPSVSRQPFLAGEPSITPAYCFVDSSGDFSCDIPIASPGALWCVTHGRSWCGEECVNTNIDPDNCGSCGNVCLAGQNCCNGVCCGETYCPDATGGPGNYDTCNDASNCGKCKNPCPDGTVCDCGQCVKAS